VGTNLDVVINDRLKNLSGDACKKLLFTPALWVMYKNLFNEHLNKIINGTLYSLVKKHLQIILYLREFLRLINKMNDTPFYESIEQESVEESQKNIKPYESFDNTNIHFWHLGTINNVQSIPY
jgi:hypothetical protein